jgi:cephalosporin-C deacetylase-like acetyl esterase
MGTEVATGIERADVTFDSWGERCAAWLYRPRAPSGDAPCVVMAPG